MTHEGSHPLVPHLRGLIRRPHWLVSMSLGLGLCRPWPGTWGSAGGVGLFLMLQPLPTLVRIAAYGLILTVAVAACTKTGRDLGDIDHQSIVVDETVGMSLTLETVAREPLLWLPAFLLFRFFDIRKPWPVRLCGDSFPGGWGVMADDLAAAAYAACLLAGAVLVFGL